MNDEQTAAIRLECLRIAINAVFNDCSDKPKEVIEEAEKYANFVFRKDT